MRARRADKLAEFERFFVQNFCKLPGEEFAVVCDGWVETGKSVIKGQVFVSDLRIIATGVQEAKKARVSGGGVFAFLSLIQLGSYMYNKSIMEQITKGITEGFTMVNYGAQSGVVITSSKKPRDSEQSKMTESTSKLTCLTKTRRVRKRLQTLTFQLSSISRILIYRQSSTRSKVLSERMQKQSNRRLLVQYIKRAVPFAGTCMLCRFHFWHNYR
jgi:hypothetical protein